mgnify:CR=1 FL=1
MKSEELKQFLKDKGRFYFILLLLNILLIAGSVMGITWIAGDNHRTLFGDKINLIEMRILNDKAAIESYNASAEEDKQLKAAALKYSELSLGQNLMIRQLIDLGFLGFLFWNGFYGLAMSISFKRFTKKAEQFFKED